MSSTHIRYTRLNSTEDSLNRDSRSKMASSHKTVFRSEEMTLCDYFLQPEAAFACIAALGELGLVQFRDMNEGLTAFQRKYTTDIRRCDEMERICRYVDKEIAECDQIRIFEADENPPVLGAKDFHDLETSLEKLESELKEVIMNAKSLERNYVDLLDMRHVLAYAQLHTDATAEAGPVAADESDFSDKAILTAADGSQTEMSLASLNYITGVIPRDKVVSFERMLWRVARGNIYLRHAAVVQVAGLPQTAGIAAMSAEQAPKEVFIAFFQGEQLKSRIKKICDAFHAVVHTFPNTVAERLRVKAGIETRIADLVSVLAQTEDHRHRLLLSAAAKLRLWQGQIFKVKTVYHELNKFNVDVSNKCLIGDGWCPTAELPRIRDTLTRSSQMAGSSVPCFATIRETKAQPPTYFRLNKFTSAFQSIVHSYGVANYREINPALYTTITFPFLFAVMFGDIGHGFIMFLAGLFLVLKERDLMKMARADETFGMFFGGRYIILLMGAFSIYTGAIYNDIFSKSIKIFPTAWYINPNMSVYINADQPDASVMMLEPANNNGTNGTLLNWKVLTDEPYPFGLDPIWNGATNEIMFSDSMKMKMSVILGVIQMLFGLLLSVGNHIYFKKYINIFCEFIPMLMFMSSIFIYMDVLIIWKWIFITPEDSHCAPSILIGVINMVLFTPSNSPCPNDIFKELNSLQIGLVLTAVISIPWLLLLKPYILWRRNKAKVAERAASAGLLPGGSYQPPKILHGGDGDEDEILKEKHAANAEDAEAGTSKPPAKKPAPPSGGGGHGDEHDDEHFDFSEEFIHQAIHTIEFCLGLVSHTASYLRLWALSLAHVELSQVLWMYLLKLPLSAGSSSFLGAAMTVPLFTGWATLTIGILILMEGLSAFLHALRLHWVEFQSKFYGGSGYAFQPFSFTENMDADDA